MINSGTFKSAFALFRLYKLNFFLSILVYTSLLFMLALIINLNVILNYVFQAKYGFYPDVAVFVEKTHKEDFFSRINAIAERFSQRVRTGYGLHLKNIKMEMENDNYSLPEDINLVGIVLSGDSNLPLALSSGEKNCPVSRIRYEGFGAWLIVFNPCLIDDVESIEGLSVIPGEAFKEGKDEIQLDIDTYDAPLEKVLAFYNLLINFADRFVELDHLGLPQERFALSGAEDIAIRKLEDAYSAKLNDVFAIIFGNEGVVPLLVDAQLYRDYSGYTSREISLSLENFPLWIHNKIYSAPEFEATEDAKYFLTNIMLGNKKDIMPIESANSYYFAHFFLESRALVNALKNELGQKAIILLKSDILPNIKAKMGLYQAAIWGAYCVMIGMVIIILIVSLNEFFMRFEKELTFMVIYGFKGLVFTSFQMLALIVSSGVSYLILNYTFATMNEYLTNYYFPPVVISSHGYLYALGSAMLIILLISLIERRHILKKSMG